VSSVIVPTVERVVFTALRCSIAMAEECLQCVHLRLVHAVEKLPRVRREGLDVAALSFRKERVERERAFLRAAESGHNDQLPDR
jgi:hypothetical protein